MAESFNGIYAGINGGITQQANAIQMNQYTFHAIEGNIAVDLSQPTPETPPSGNTQDAHILAQALAPFAATNVWAHQSGEPTKWTPGNDNLEISIGYGSGQRQSPFSTSLNDFVKSCVSAKFRAPFLRKLTGRCSMFESHFTFGAAVDKSSPTALEIGMSNYENDSFTLLLRYDIPTNRVRAILFLKLEDTLRGKRSGITTIKDLTNFLDQQASTFRGQPILIANSILTFIQHYSATDYVTWRYDLYDLESKLGVTPRATVFQNAGYDGVSFDYDTLNARLAWLSARAADTTLSASTLQEHASALLRLSDSLDNDDDGKESKTKISLRHEEIQSTITRANLYLNNAVMVDAALNSMRAVLYNRITKHDSNSMKTIAVVTLFFLPGTFISSIFSTGVFDFFARVPEHSKTTSSWAWIYLLTSILLTAVVLALWLIWYRWGGLWLEKLHLKRAYRQDGKVKRKKAALSVVPTARDFSTSITVPSNRRLTPQERQRLKDVERGLGGWWVREVPEEEGVVSMIQRLVENAQDGEDRGSKSS